MGDAQGLEDGSMTPRWSMSTSASTCWLRGRRLGCWWIGLVPLMLISWLTMLVLPRSSAEWANASANSTNNASTSTFWVSTRQDDVLRYRSTRWFGNDVVQGVIRQSLPAGASLLCSSCRPASETLSTGLHHAALVSRYTVWGWSVGFNSRKGTTSPLRSFATKSWLLLVKCSWPSVMARRAPQKSRLA